MIPGALLLSLWLVAGAFSRETVDPDTVEIRKAVITSATVSECPFCHEALTAKELQSQSVVYVVCPHCGKGFHIARLREKAKGESKTR